MKIGLTVANPSSMIQSTSLSTAAARAQALQPVKATASNVSTPVGTDNLSTNGINQLRAALKATPEARPEVVARGQALAADATYPSAPIIRHVSARIVNSPDLSIDSSAS
jgi:hypothetical protein